MHYTHIKFDLLISPLFSYREVILMLAEELGEEPNQDLLLNLGLHELHIDEDTWDHRFTGVDDTAPNIDALQELAHSLMLDEEEPAWIVGFYPDEGAFFSWVAEGSRSEVAHSLEEMIREQVHPRYV